MFQLSEILDALSSKGAATSNGAASAAAVKAAASPAAAMQSGPITWDQVNSNFSGKNNDVYKKFYDDLGKSLGVQGSQQYTLPNYYDDWTNPENPSWAQGMQAFRPSDALSSAAGGVTFSPEMSGRNPAFRAYSADGKDLGLFQTGSHDTLFDKYAPVIAMSLLGAGAGAAIGGAAGLSGAGAAAATGAGAGAGSAAASGGNVLKGALLGGITGGVGSYASDALGAYMGGSGTQYGIGAPVDSLSGVNAETLASLNAAGSGVTQAQVNAAALGAGGNLIGGASGGLLGSMPTIDGGAAQSLSAYSAANPVTMADVVKGMPALNAAPAATAATAATSYDALRAGEKADYGQTTGNVPKTVNMGSLGGTTSTVGGLQGAYDVAAQTAKDATATGLSTGKSGGLLSNTQLGEWMKENPLLGKLLTSGATSLLSLSGGGSGGSGGAAAGSMPATYTGSAPTWNSPTTVAQPGLLSPVKRATPPQLSGLGLLNVGGQQNDGAWRYLRG